MRGERRLREAWAGDAQTGLPKSPAALHQPRVQIRRFLLVAAGAFPVTQRRAVTRVRVCARHYFWRAAVAPEARGGLRLTEARPTRGYGGDAERRRSPGRAHGGNLVAATARRATGGTREATAGNQAWASAHGAQRKHSWVPVDAGGR